jgi:hypothetical protein
MAYESQFIPRESLKINQHPTLALITVKKALNYQEQDIKQLGECHQKVSYYCICSWCIGFQR